MRRKNTSTVFLKECIGDALIRLMEEKPFEKITITEMTVLAGVGRATYFRNFSSKSDVLVFKLISMWDQFAQEHGLTQSCKYSMDSAEYLFEFSFQIRDLQKLIYNANLQSALYDAFYQVMVPPDGASTISLYRNRFFSYGLFGLLDEWIRRGYRESPKEMAWIIKEHILFLSDKGRLGLK